MDFLFCLTVCDTLVYDQENKLTSITVGANTTTYVYDGDGNRVKKTANGVSTFYVGNHYEVTNGNALKYYYFGKQRVAMRTSAGVVYLHSDHLGSTSATSGASVSAQTYYAFGNIRSTTGSVPTDYGFTGQRRDASAGLMYYGARYYDATLGRFVSADTMVPQAGNPQGLNRYSYVGNNPLKYTDPSGHCWGVASGARSLPTYDVTCGNLDMALTIVQHPNASAVEKAFAGWYIATEGTAHVSLVVGSSVLAWQAIAPAAAVGEAACADGDCANEARAAARAVELTAEEAKNIATASQTASQSGTTVLGTFRTPFATTEIPEIASKRAFFWETASEIRANAMQVPDSIWNSLSRSSQWLVNKSFLDLAIQRGDRFRLAASYNDTLRRYIQLRAEGVQFEMMPGFIKELIYLEQNGYRLASEVIGGQEMQYMVK